MAIADQLHNPTRAEQADALNVADTHDAAQRAVVHYTRLARDAERVTALETELLALQAGFDPAYQYSNDHSVFCRHDATAKRMAEIRRELAQVLQ